MKLVLVGIQGAGKSTQGNMLSAKLGIPYLSSGHVFREMSKEKTQLGRMLKELLTAGSLVPHDLTMEILTTYLQKPEYSKGYILDGFPRTIEQAKDFKENIDKVIMIEVSDREALWRISGRVDDRGDETLQAIRKRIGWFHDETEPMVEFYRQQGKVIVVDGEKEVDEVFNQIMSHLS